MNTRVLSWCAICGCSLPQDAFWLVALSRQDYSEASELQELRELGTESQDLLSLEEAGRASVQHALALLPSG